MPRPQLTDVQALAAGSVCRVLNFDGELTPSGGRAELVPDLLRAGQSPGGIRS